MSVLRIGVSADSRGRFHARPPKAHRAVLQAAGRIPNCAVISETLCAQERPQFEVASIKPFLPAPGVGRGGGGCTPFKMDRGRVDMCATLATAIGYAYRIPRSRILGPDWLTGRTAKTLTATLRTLQEVFAE